MIHAGTQDRVISEVQPTAGTTVREGSIGSDSLLATLWVDYVTAGTLSISIFTLTDEGKEVLLFSFPVVSAGTTDLLLKKSGVSMQRFRITATYTGACSYEVYIRAINGIGESTTKILGANSLTTDSIAVTTTPAVFIASTLVDRNGLTILNFGGTGILYLSEDITKLPARAWPVPPSAGWSLDIAAGVTIYSVSSSGILDVRIAQSGT